MRSVVWRVRCLAVPGWPAACPRCASPVLESTGRFRVNANGRRHDVWLLYRCPRCGHRRKRSVLRRLRGGGPDALDGYRRDDAGLARHWAFALSPGVRVAYRVERPPLPGAGVLAVRIDEPLPCGARWDAFLARELGGSRRQVAARWRAGAIRAWPAARPRDPVRDGSRLGLVLGDGEPPDGRGRR